MSPDVYCNLVNCKQETNMSFSLVCICYFVFFKLSLNQSQFLASCCTNGLVCTSAVQTQWWDRCYWQFFSFDYILLIFFEVAACFNLFFFCIVLVTCINCPLGPTLTWYIFLVLMETRICFVNMLEAVLVHVYFSCPPVSPHVPWLQMLKSSWCLYYFSLASDLLRTLRLVMDYIL